MSEGRKYLKLYDQGLTYKEIAQAYGVARSTVAGRIYDYRKENNIPVSDKGRKISEAKKQTKKSRADLSEYDREQKKQRQKAIDECERREDGVLKCPDRYAEGYGMQPSKLFGGVVRG